MKTLRYRDGDSVKPGILDQDGVIRGTIHIHIVIFKKYEALMNS